MTKSRLHFTFVRLLFMTFYLSVSYFLPYLQNMVLLLSALVILETVLICFDQTDDVNANKKKAKAIAVSSNAQKLQRNQDKILSSMRVLDGERDEWLNQIIGQLWPTVKESIVKVFRGSLQTKIRRKHDLFRFESIDFGQIPPKISGIRLYNSSIIVKDGIIIDFDIFYHGNCDINFSVSRNEVGRIHDFQLTGKFRVVLKPILSKMPLIGGIQAYFLHAPNINFILDGLSSIPSLSASIRSKIEEKISKKIVFPNKITKQFFKSVEPLELQALEPAGVLRVHVLEAKDLVTKNIAGKSNLYAILFVGAQEHKTPTVNQSLNPKWDDWCEFVVRNPKLQSLGFKLFDHNNGNDDDFLGSGEVYIGSVLKSGTDQWLEIDNARHSAIYLRFTWLSLSSDLDLLHAITEETRLLQVTTVAKAVLIVYVDMAVNLPEAMHEAKPCPFFTLLLGNQTEKSKVKKHIVDPAWEQGFVFLVANPNQETLHLTISDETTGNLLSQFSYRLVELASEPDLQFSKQELPLSHNGSKIVLSLQLRILTKNSNL